MTADLALPLDHLRRIALRRAHAVAAYDDAEDLAQEALINVWRARGRYPTAADLAKVTATSVTNVAISRRRAAGQLKRTAPPPEPPVSLDTAAEAIAAVFVDWCLERCRDARERTILVAWMDGTSPARLLAARPDLFASAREIYNVDRNLRARLRRAYMGEYDDADR